MLKPWHELQADSSERFDDIPWLAPRAKIGPGNNPITVDVNGQFESTMLFQSGQTGTWKAWDLTALTQKWISGTAANYGVILWATSEDVNSYDLRFYSSEHENKQPQLMITWSDQPKTVYFLKDHLGSIRATVLDSAGAPVVAYDDYDPWGYILENRTKTRAWGDNQAIAENKFTGKEWDDDYGVNWLHFPYRSYDPEIARWMVRDPLAMNYPSWSPYIYAANNPIIYFDPDGKSIWTKSIKVVVKLYKTGSAAQAFVDNIADARTLFNSEASFGERALAAISLASEFAPVSVGDVKDAARAVDNVSGAIKGAEIGVDVVKAGRGLSSAEKSIFTKIDNIIGDHLTSEDIRGAVGDLKGQPVIIGGKQYDHLGEVQDAQRGLVTQIKNLVTQIKKLKKALTDPRLSPEARKQIEQKLGETSKFLDETEEFVPRGGNK